MLINTAWLALEARKSFKGSKDEQEKLCKEDSNPNGGNPANINQSKASADKTNDQNMLRFFQMMIDKFDIASTPQELYDKVFTKDMDEAKKQRVIKNTLRHIYVERQEMGRGEPGNPEDDQMNNNKETRS